MYMYIEVSVLQLPAERTFSAGIVTCS